MDDPEVAWAAKLEELRGGAVSHGVEWLRGALWETSRDELRALAAVGGVETRSSENWLPLAELRDGLMKVLAPCQKLFFHQICIFVVKVECSSHGAIL